MLTVREGQERRGVRILVCEGGGQRKSTEARLLTLQELRCDHKIVRAADSDVRRRLQRKVAPDGLGGLASLGQHPQEGRR